jgi:triosephosphate isomerase
MSYFSETDETVNFKAKFSFANGLLPIICVGETLSEREAGKADEVISTQVKKALDGLTADQVKQTVIAYEPVWAIGTGKTCDTPEAQRICAMIRSTVAGMYGQEVADALRVQYGGSVKPSNAAELLSQPDIDGALVGGASLKSADFMGIINGAK